MIQLRVSYRCGTIDAVLCDSGQWLEEHAVSVVLLFFSLLHQLWQYTTTPPSNCSPTAPSAKSKFYGTELASKMTESLKTG